MNEDRCAPIRDLLGRLDGRPKPRPSRCGGALLSVDRASYEAMASRGTEWATPIEDVPDDGTKVDARVACDADLLEKVGVAGKPVQLSSCARCAGLESGARELLAEEQAKREGPR